MRRFRAGTLSRRIVTNRVIGERNIDRIETLEIHAETGIEINFERVDQVFQIKARGAVVVRVDRPLEVPHGRARGARRKSESARRQTGIETVGAVTAAVERVLREVRSVETQLATQTQFDAVRPVSGVAAVRVTAAEDGIVRYVLVIHDHSAGRTGESCSQDGR